MKSRKRSARSKKVTDQIPEEENEQDVRASAKGMEASVKNQSSIRDKKSSISPSKVSKKELDLTQIENELGAADGSVIES